MTEIPKDPAGVLDMLKEMADAGAGPGDPRLEGMMPIITGFAENNRLRGGAPLRILGMLEAAREWKPRGPHPRKGELVANKNGGEPVRIEGWFEELAGTPFLSTELVRPPWIIHACRMIDGHVPADNDVVCVKGEHTSGLLHDSELGEAS